LFSFLLICYKHIKELAIYSRDIKLKFIGGPTSRGEMLLSSLMEKKLLKATIYLKKLSILGEIKLKILSDHAMCTTSSAGPYSVCGTNV
jgi:hypothetical protein